MLIKIADNVEIIPVNPLDAKEFFGIVHLEDHHVYITAICESKGMLVIPNCSCRKSVSTASPGEMAIHQQARIEFRAAIKEHFDGNIHLHPFGEVTYVEE